MYGVVNEQIKLFYVGKSMYIKRKVFFLLLVVMALAINGISSDFAVIVEPDDGAKPIINFINNAKEKINIAIYQIIGYSHKMDTPILNALAAAKKRGVAVRIILNNFKNNTWPVHGKETLKKEIQWCRNNKIQYRLSSKAFSYFHNKYVIIDERKALIMTGNLTADSFPPNGNTRNFIVVDVCEAHAKYLSKLFSVDWKNARKNSAYAPKDKPADLLVNPNDGYSVYKIADEINKAKQSLDIYMMYFDESSPSKIVKAIRNAAERGVMVRLLCSSTQKLYVMRKKFGSKRKGNYKYSKYFKFIIQPRKSVLPFIHAKVFIIDSKLAILGSMNMSYTSFYRNREVSLCLSSETEVKKIQNVFDSDWRNFSKK